MFTCELNYSQTPSSKINYLMNMVKIQIDLTNLTDNDVITLILVKINKLQAIGTI